MARPPVSAPTRQRELGAWGVPRTRRDWAWEFLRRNPDYRREQFGRSADDPSLAKWGLSFR